MASLLPVVAEERVIAAPAQQIFDLLADPSRHHELDGSGSVRASREGNPARLSLGAEFAMDMHVGTAYRVTNRVVEFEEGRLIAWRHFGGHRWRYVLTPVATGTLVREEWDASRLSAPVQIAHRLLRFPQRNRAAMAATLQRLDHLMAAA